MLRLRGMYNMYTVMIRRNAIYEILNKHFRTPFVWIFPLSQKATVMFVIGPSLSLIRHYRRSLSLVGF
jgi:hypothetical protein